MARPLEHSASFPQPPDEVVETLLDGDYLAARLAELGGKDAVVANRDVEGHAGRIVLRQGVPVEFLPSVVRRFTGDDLVLDRTETWRPRDAGGATADVEVTVRGLPGSITGTQEVVPDGEGSRVTFSGSTAVPVPMVGGKIEGIVVEQVGNLLGWESEFLGRWLAG